MATPWRDDPALREKFREGHPDDIQVVVHEGGPRFTRARPELAWVRTTSAAGLAYRGELLDDPSRLATLARGDTILFLPARGADNPIRVSAQYLAERPLWDITPCSGCGLGELFDPPSALIRAAFPNAPAGHTMVRFSATCPRCGGTQHVLARANLPFDEALVTLVRGGRRRSRYTARDASAKRARRALGRHRRG